MVDVFLRGELVFNERRREKGAIRFPASKPLPATLVKKLVKARLAENLARDGRTEHLVVFGTRRMTTPPPTNYWRRAAGAAICLAIPFLFVVSFVDGLYYSKPGWFVGAWPLIWSAGIGGINFYPAFIRPWLYQCRNGSTKDYRHDSGVPFLGYLGLLPALLLGWGAVGTAAFGFVLCFVDTCNLVWFPIMTWRDDSFWDS